MNIVADKSEICAGIVLYNPEENRLKENINAILPQVSRLFLIDNASYNIKKIEEAWGNNCNIQIIKNTTNEGIARALNQMCDAAISQKYKWILTLDQDSVCPNNLIKLFIPYTSQPAIGIICPHFRLNLKGYQQKTEHFDKDYDFIKYCITSASLTNLVAWNESGKFDDKMFIDCVDYDFCIKLRLAKFNILRINHAVISHEVGRAKVIPMFFKKKIIVYNHSTLRNYYMVRNTIYLLKKYYFIPDVYKWIPRLAYWELCKLLFEEKKMATLLSVANGLKDGFTLSREKI